MPFPISLSGEVAVRDLGVDDAIERLELALARVDARALEREGVSLRFRGGVFRLVSNWNVLVPISRGVLRVTTWGTGVKVTYRVGFEEMLVIVTLMAAGVGVFGMVAPHRDAGIGLAGVAVAWLWLFGANFVATRLRWPAFLRRSLSRPPP